MAPSPPPPRRVAWAAAGLLTLIGGALRLWLAGRYWGAEEEDWGNLLTIRGVLDSGFGYVETEHMPLYSWLSAAATTGLGDPRSGGLLVAIVAGALAVGATAWIGARWFSPRVGVVAGLLVAFQPESALYSATTLRTSTYVALTLLGVALVGERRGILGGLALGLAFLARFDAAFTLLPALLLLTLLDRRDRPLRWAIPALILGAVVLLWAAWYRVHLGTWAFWGGVAARNAGDAVQDLFPRERLAATTGAVWGLITRLLPGHVGHVVVPLAAVGLWRRGRARRPDAARWLGLAGALTLALLILSAGISGYEWTHNLLWKWTTMSVPFLALFAAHAVDLTPRPALAAALLLLVTAPAYALEGRSQLQRSRAWYGTQVELARWIERAFPPGVSVITDVIPAWYLEARRSPVRVIPWHDTGLDGADPEAFGRFLTEQRVAVVQWFREPWVGAEEVAPWLAAGKAFAAGPRILVPIARQDDYGFIAYLVSQGPEVPEPSEPPPADAGALPSP